MKKHHSIFFAFPKFSLIFLVCMFFINSPSLFSDTDDALFDLAKQTDSLLDYYNERMIENSFAVFLGFHVGFDVMEFKNYPVTTEFGYADFGIIIARSFIRLDLINDTVIGNKSFNIRGFDFSGKAVSLSKPFVVDGIGYSELHGKIEMQDMFLGLFTLFNIKIDAGFMRNRIVLSGYTDSSGIHSNKMGEMIWSYIMPYSNDIYSFYFGLGYGKLYDLSFRVQTKIESMDQILSFVHLFKDFGWFILPGFIEELALTFRYESPEYFIGLNTIFDYHKLTEKNYYGFNLNSYTSYSFTTGKIDDSKIELIIDSGYYLKTGFSYLTDERLIPFGAKDGNVFGYCIGGGVLVKEILEIGGMYSYNYSDTLEYLSGALNHHVFKFLLKVHY